VWRGPAATPRVDSVARPGGNATGFLLFEYGTSGKWLELLKEIAPGVTRVAVIRDAAIAAEGRVERSVPTSSARWPMTFACTDVRPLKKCGKRSPLPT